MTKLLIVHSASNEVNQAIDLLVDLENQYPGIIQHELLDFLKVLESGAQKYALNNWLEPNGKRSKHKETHDSMFHHLAESFANQRIDKESGFDPLLHLACRALMRYTRLQRGIQDT